MSLQIAGSLNERFPFLRVAFCIDNFNIGGTELNAVRSALLLKASGVDLTVISLAKDGPLRERYLHAGIPVELLPIGKLYGLKTAQAGWRLTQLIRQKRISVVHAHDLYSNIFAAPWARLAGAAFIASRRWWDIPGRHGLMLVNRLAYLFAHRVLANSASVADLLLQEEWVPSHQVTVVPNFVDAEMFIPPPPAWIDSIGNELQLPPPPRQIIGAVANLSPSKDHATLVKAFSRIVARWPKAYLVLVGADAGCQASLEELVRQLGIQSNVRFAGLRPSTPSMHHFFDISALTSISEGLPNSLLEAMAASRPVVATAVGAVPDAVQEGHTGFLVRPGDANLLASRLDYLLANPQLQTQLGRAGLERAKSVYTKEAAVAGLLGLYQSLSSRVNA